MLQQYYGNPRIESLGGGRFSPLHQRGRTASHGQHLNLFANLGLRKANKFAEVRGGSLDLPATSEDNELVYVNVSGRIYEFPRKILKRYPESLLAKRAQAGNYYDFDKKDYFFDRNRIAFDSIYHFYQTQGQVVIPEKYPEQLIIDELYFFGLYSYLSTRQKQQLVQPSETVKEEIVPKYKWQLKMWRLLDQPQTNLLSKIISIASLFVIVFSIAILCAETLPSMRLQRKREYNTYQSELFVLESFCIFYFTIEIILRFIASPIKLKFLFKVLNIIDLTSILPYYIILALESDYSNKAIVSLRVFRLARAFRILKVSRYVSGMKVLGQTLREALSDLWMIAFLTVIGTLLFASCAFYFEQIWDPGTPFESIPLAFWWSIVTISTVGYGDMAPKTLAGKFVGSTCAISGVLLIAPLLPIIYERWQHFYQLDQDGKRIKAGHKLLRDLKKKRRTPSSFEGSNEPPNDKSGTKKKREPKVPKVPKVPETKQRKVAETKGKPQIASTPSKNKKDQEIDEDERESDDLVWLHIKRASIKRRESSKNLLRSDSTEGKKSSSKGSVPSKRSPDAKSSNEKDIVSTKQSNSNTRSKEKMQADRKETEKCVTVEKPLEKPVFIVGSKESVNEKRGWDKPGPSNIKY